MLVFVLICYHPNHNIIIFYKDDLYIEIESSLFGQCLIMKELIRWTMEFLYIIETDFKLVEVFGCLVDFETNLLTVFLEFFCFLGLGSCEEVSFYRSVLFSLPGFMQILW